MGNFPNNFMFRSGGSGSSSGGSAGINYVPLIFAGDSLTGINTYNDGASAVPVDGTGGVVTGLTTALDTTTPLVGSSSVRFSKDASNRQGEGWSYDYTVDRLSYEASNPLFWQFYVRTSSGYVNGDIRLFVYDKDTGTLLTVQDIANNSGSIVPNPNDGLISCTFYTTATSNDYRLIWHIAGTTAAAWDFDWDNITVSPQTTQPGYIGSYLGTETWTDSWANATTSVEVYRDGSRIFLKGLSSVTGAGATQFDITIPSAYAASSTYTWGSNEAIYVGFSNSYDLSGTANFVGWASITSSTNLRILYSNAGAIAGLTSTLPFTWASGDKIQFTASWIVSGWAASAALSTTETMFSTVKARYTTNVAQSMANGTATRIDFEDKEYDTANAVTTGASWVFTSPKSTYYHVCSGSLLAANAGWAAGEALFLTLHKNGSGTAYTTIYYDQANAAGTFSKGGAGGTTLYLAKGETVDIRMTQASGGAISLDASGANNWVSIDEIPDFSIFSVFGQTELLPATGFDSGGLVSYPITVDQWGDLDSETLTPGEWDLNVTGVFASNGATTTGAINLGVSTTSGNSSTGLTTGLNRVTETKATTSGTFSTLSFEQKGIVVTSSTTYYFKAFAATSITNLQIGWSWRFRRVK